MQITRTCDVAKATIGTTPAASTPLNFGNYGGGTVANLSASVALTLVWYTSIDGITWYADAAANTSLPASQSAQIPLALFGAKFITATDGTGGTVAVSLKS